MARFLLRISARNQRKYRILILAFLWILGLYYGIHFQNTAGDSVSSLMRMAACSPVSIVNLLMVSFLPFLFSIFLVYIHCPLLIGGLCFIKAWLFGFVSAGCVSAFGTAGWLVWFLSQFSDILCLIPLWYFWISHSGDQQGFDYRHLSMCLTAVFCIIFLDYWFISPFLVTLI